MKLTPAMLDRLASAKPDASVTLPARYDDLTQRQRVLVRAEYTAQQGGACWHCQCTLTTDPPEHVMVLTVRNGLFPPGFFDHPVHLHHDHRTGLTIGAVHARCNAVLWQYHGV